MAPRPRVGGTFTHASFGTMGNGKGCKWKPQFISWAPRGVIRKRRCVYWKQQPWRAGRGHQGSQAARWSELPGDRGGLGAGRRPWLLRRGLTQWSQDDSQPAAPSRAPGCLPAGGTALPSPGPRPCPPAGHQTAAADPAGAHSSRRSASCLQRRDPRL